jgi:prephenate dehydrogenase
MPFKKTLIIGIGLIGGSFAKTLKKHSLTNEIIACDFDEDSLELAKTENVINEGFSDLIFLEDELSKFDLIVVATPLSSYEEIFSQIANVKAKVIDLGSVKDFKFKKMPQNFIPCHPIAGLENSGFEYSDADLFKDKKFIICKEDKEIENLITKIGAKCEFLDSKKHDEIYALVSHLPQFLSFLTKDFSPEKLDNEFLQKSFRLDNSDPEIWEDIFAMNEKNLEKFYIEFFDNFEKNCQKNADEITKEISESSSYFKASVNFSMDLVCNNFDKILPRLIVVLSYLQISEIRKFSTYAGTGFKDFTSPILLTNFDKEKIGALIEKNKKHLSKLLKSIS